MVVLEHVAWRKSGRSNTNGDCVEFAVTGGGMVAVRDSKDPTGPVLGFPTASWRSFVDGLRRR